eukprot:14740258-Alexandrium_andersonii.AAC.1
MHTRAHPQGEHLKFSALVGERKLQTMHSARPEQSEEFGSLHLAASRCWESWTAVQRCRDWLEGEMHSG